MIMYLLQNRKQFLPYLCSRVTFKLKNISPQLYCTNNNGRTKIAGNRFQSFVPFDQFVESKRQEANRSIIIQVKQRKSCDDLLNHCSKFGTLKNAHFIYSNDISNHVIIEYNESEEAQAALKDTYYLKGDDLCPVYSPFLLFFPPVASHVQVEKNSLRITEEMDLPKKEDLRSLFTETDSFSDDMVILYKRMKITDTSQRLRFIIAVQLEFALKSMFSRCKVIPIGSSINGFGKNNCDLNLVWEMVVQLVSKNSRLGFQMKESKKFHKKGNKFLLEVISNLMKVFLPCCNKIEKVLNAPVPYVKYNQTVTGMECNITVDHSNSVYMTELLYLYSFYDERVCPLLFTVRFWAEEVNLTYSQPGDWISNFSLTLLVLFFLQQERIIPAVDLLIKNDRIPDLKTVGKLNRGFLIDLRVLNDTETLANNDSLLILLLKFFSFYGSFNFKACAISLNSGIVIPKRKAGGLYIVNPFEKELNVSHNVNPNHVDKFRMECLLSKQLIERSMPNAISDICTGKKFGLLNFIESRSLNRFGFSQGRSMGSEMKKENHFPKMLK